MTSRGPSAGLIDELRLLVTTDELARSRRRLTGLDPSLVPALTDAARAHGVEAWLSACLPSPEPPWQELADQRARFLAARARSWTTAHTLGELLDGHGYRWALLKGFAIALSCYPRPDLRYSVDLDVLVDPVDFQSVVGLLSAEGYQVLELNWPLLAELEPGQLRLRAPNGVLVDLHWHLLNQRALRAAFAFNTDQLLDRAVPLAGTGLRALAPLDALLHTGVHAAFGGANRLCWLVDLDRLVRSQQVDWDQLRQLAEHSRGGRPLSIALRRARAALATPVPEPVLRGLAGGAGALTVQRLLDVRSRLLVDPLQPSFSRAVARSSRAGWWQSQWELARHGLGWLSSKRGNLEQSWLDPRSRTSALHPVPDEVAERAYYQAVKRAGAAMAPCRIGLPVEGAEPACPG